MRTLARAGIALVLSAPALSIAIGTGVAHAATGVSMNGTELSVVSAAGAANDITVVKEADRLVVRDAGAALTTGSGCLAAGVAVTCPLPRNVRVELGDGDDRVLFNVTLPLCTTAGE